MKPVYVLPALGWAIIVLIAIGLPGNILPGSDLMKIPHFDKLVHGILFFVFAFLTAYGFYKQDASTSAHRHYASWTILAGIVYGMGTEFLQYHVIPGRYGNLPDVAANAIGTVFGLLMFRALVLFSK
jgi:VanZ family protein